MTNKIPGHSPGLGLRRHASYDRKCVLGRDFRLIQWIVQAPVETNKQEGFQLANMYVFFCNRKSKFRRSASKTGRKRLIFGSLSIKTCFWSKLRFLYISLEQIFKLNKNTSGIWSYWIGKDDVSSICYLLQQCIFSFYILYAYFNWIKPAYA